MAGQQDSYESPPAPSIYELWPGLARPTTSDGSAAIQPAMAPATQTPPLPTRVPRATAPPSPWDGFAKAWETNDDAEPQDEAPATQPAEPFLPATQPVEPFLPATQPVEPFIPPARANVAVRGAARVSAEEAAAVSVAAGPTVYQAASVTPPQPSADDQRPHSPADDQLPGDPLPVSAPPGFTVPAPAPRPLAPGTIYPSTGRPSAAIPAVVNVRSGDRPLPGARPPGTVYGGAIPRQYSPMENSGSLTGHILSQASSDLAESRSRTTKIIILVFVLVLLVAAGLAVAAFADAGIGGLFTGVLNG